MNKTAFKVMIIFIIIKILLNKFIPKVLGVFFRYYTNFQNCTSYPEKFTYQWYSLV